MKTKYCALCERYAPIRRKVGVGSLIMFIVTGGVWLLAMLFFYRKRCAICGGTTLQARRPPAAVIDNRKAVSDG